MDAMTASARQPASQPGAWARAAATGGLDDGERAPPGDPAEAGAAATYGRDLGERAPPCGSAEARAATMGVRDVCGDDVERCAMSRELVTKRRSESNRTVGSSVASSSSGVETRRWRAGTAAGEDLVAGTGAGRHHERRKGPPEEGRILCFSP